MSFPYVRGLPNPPDDPSQDVGGMQANTNTIDDWTQTDHIGFNNSAGGKHKQVTFNSKTSQASQVDPQSVLYTIAGNASSFAQLLFKNQNANFPLSALCAFGGFQTVNFPGSPTFTSSFNCTGISQSSAGVYQVTLATNAIANTSAVVLATINNATKTVTYVLTTATNLQLTMLTASSGVLINFIVLQF